MQAGAFGAQLLDGEAGRVVKVQGVAVGAQALGLLADMGYLLQAAGEVAPTQVGVGVARHFAGHQALHELQDGHFEAENGRVLAVVKGGGTGEMQHGGRFAHCGAGGQDDEVRWLPAAGKAIELGEAGRHAGKAVLADGLGKLGEGGFLSGGGGLAGAGFEAAVQGGQVGLGVAEQSQRVAGVVVAVGGHFGAGLYDDAAGVLLLQGAAVGFEVGGRVDFAREAGDEGGTAGAGQGAAAAQLLGDGEDVGVVADLHQVANGPVDLLVGGAVENFLGGEGGQHRALGVGFEEGRA